MTLTKQLYKEINITLNSLVFDFCNFSKKFDDNIFRETLSINDHLNYVYTSKTNFISKRIIESFINIIDMKIFVGERVIIREANLLDEETLRKILLNFYEKKINMYSIINDNIDKKIINNLVKNFTTIIRERDNKIVFCKKIENDDKIIENNYSGITVVGDVHGEKEKLIRVIDWANKNDNFMIFLGDIVNHGPNSIECVEIIYDLVIRNKALLILGNHERKLFKLINKELVHLNDACEQTLEKISLMKEKEKKSWFLRFNTLINLGKYFFKYKNSFFCHGGFTEKLLKYKNDLELNNKIKNICMFGDIDIFKEKKYTKKSFSNVLKSQWLKYLPPNFLIFLGHTMIEDRYPYIFSSNNNSKVYFIDTGAGKGGFLTSVDLKINNNRIYFKNFNLW